MWQFLLAGQPLPDVLVGHLAAPTWRLAHFLAAWRRDSGRSARLRRQEKSATEGKGSSMYSLKVQQGRPTIQGWRHLFVACGAPRCFARGKNRLPVRRCGLEVAPSGPGPPSALQTFHQCPKGLAPGAAGIYRAPQTRASGSTSPSSPRARNGATSNARRRAHAGALRCVFFRGTLALGPGAGRAAC